MIASPAAESRLFTFESRLDRFVEQRLDAIRAFLEASPGGTLELADPAGLCPIAWLGERLGLTPSEEQVLWLLVAHALCPLARTRLRQLATEDASEPTIELLQRLIYRHARVAWRELGEAGALLRLGLVARTDAGSAPQYRQTLQASSRVLALVHGERALDPALTAIARIVDRGSELEQLEIGAAIVERVAQALQTPDAIVALHGPAGSGRRSLLVALAQQRGNDVLVVDGSALAGDQLRSIARECALFDLVPLIQRFDAVDVAACERELPGLVLATSARPIARRWQRPATFIELPPATGRQRARLWSRALPTMDADCLATTYPLSPALILAAGAAALRLDGVEAGVRAVVDDRLAGLATRVVTTQSWDDLVLPQDQFLALVELVARVRKRRRVYEDWGFGDKLARGLGVAALLSGPPGTGKTMCAGLIARELGTALYQVQPDKLASKWIGETEKNLAALFDAAEACHAVLLFDEADALFGKRTDVKSSNDRHANQEVNFLLQRLETFSGICILTTNHETALDDAFRRRIAVHVRFGMPDLAERKQLWQALIPERAPTEGDLGFDALAERFEMSGGHIRNAVLRAAFLAADEDRAITAAHLLKSAQLEYDALGRIHV